MLAMMRLCAPKSRQLLLTSRLLGHKALTSSLLLINPSCWNRTFATGGPSKDQQKIKAEPEVNIGERVPKRAGNVKSGIAVVDNQHTAGVWSDEQICKLEELVAAHTIEPEYSESLQCMTKRTTEWTTIGRLLAVDPEECKAKWKSIQDRGKKTGPFTAEEDALIVQRVAEWGDKGRGLWRSLEREMGRYSEAIFTRYKTVILLNRSSAVTFWTPDMDARLTEGVTMYKVKYGWAKVAEYVGGEVSAKQCNKRWNIYLSKAQQEGVKQGDWSDEEVSQLEELVPQHVIKPQWCKRRNIMTQERTDWIAIGQKLNRVPSNCKDKWNSIKLSRMKKGPYTAHEDALIRQRVAEWGDKGNGLWVNLQKEMGRGAFTIRNHWTAVLATRDLDWIAKESWEEQTFTPLLDRKKSKFEWSPDKHSRLKEGVAKYKEKGGWMGVAKYVGDSVTAVQCQKRWTNHVCKVQKEGVRRGKWSDKEIEKLLQLVPLHVIRAHWSEEMGVMTKERIDWVSIADQLNRVPQDCKNKSRYLKDRELKKGDFTVEEDALIRQRAAEWGNKGNGLWVSLQKELGRAGRFISMRWKQQRLGVDRPKPE